MPWQVLDKRQDISNNKATGTTQSPRAEVKTIAVFIIQQGPDGAISNLACGIGPPKDFRKRDVGVYGWSVALSKVPGKRLIKPGKALGVSVVQRPGGVTEGWLTNLMLFDSTKP